MYNDKSDIKNVALYTRVSTEEQAHSGFSLDAQLDKLRTYCKAKDWNIAGEYVDAGFSGRNINRPLYQKMFEDIDSWDAILILKMDRIHRKVKNALFMFEVLEKKGKHFISFMENIDTSTAMGRAMMTITLVFAQLESEQLGERIVIGLNQKVKESEKFMGHRVPFGYNWDVKKEVFIPVPEDLDLVKSVFQLYVDGFTMRQIGKKTGKANTTVKYFLHNCFYAGYERYCQHFRRVPGLVPIVSIDVFNNVQQLLRDHCRSHRLYKPMLIEEKEQFNLDKDMMRSIPVINRAKHNYDF